MAGRNPVPKLVCLVCVYNIALSVRVRESSADGKVVDSKRRGGEEGSQDEVGGDDFVQDSREDLQRSTGR